MILPDRQLRSRARRVTVSLLATGALIAGLTACSGSTAGQDQAAGQNQAGGDASDTAASTRVVEVTVTAAKGCTAAQSTYHAGALTFKVANTDANAVSEVELLSGERIIGEKENLPPGFSGTFSVNIGAGSYQLYCPGATPERTPVTIVGTAAGVGNATVAALLKTASTGYQTYVNTQVAALVVAVGKLNTALHGTNLAAAQKAYMQARPFYEKIEPVAESFVIGKDVVDSDIDQRLDPGIKFSTWRGFHRIEYGIFEQKSLAGMPAFGQKLVADVAKLQGLTARTSYQPTELATGASSLLDEIGKTKITGEEERYSLIDLLDFSNNDEGAEQAFAQLQPALNKIDPVLTRTIATRFTALDTLVNRYRTAANPSGFRLYSSLTSSDKRALQAAVDAVAEPLSQVSSKVANA